MNCLKKNELMCFQTRGNTISMKASLKSSEHLYEIPKNVKKIIVI